MLKLNCYGLEITDPQGVDVIILCHCLLWKRLVGGLTPCVSELLGTGTGQFPSLQARLAVFLDIDAQGADKHQEESEEDSAD